MHVKLSTALAILSVADAAPAAPAPQGRATSVGNEERQFHPALIPGGIIENLPYDIDKRQLGPSAIDGSLVQQFEEKNHQEALKEFLQNQHEEKRQLGPLAIDGSVLQKLREQNRKEAGLDKH